MTQLNNKDEIVDLITGKFGWAEKVRCTRLTIGKLTKGTHQVR